MDKIEKSHQAYPLIFSRLFACCSLIGDKPEMRAYLRTDHRLGTPLPRKIAIVRSLPGLGDLLCVIPALRALRTALPEVQITLIGLRETRALMQRFQHYLDDWLEFPGYPGIPEVPLAAQRVVSFLSEVQQSGFDLALQMHGNGSVINSFTALLSAKLNAGFFMDGHFCPDRHRFLLYPDHGSEIWRHLRLMEFLGIPLQGDHLEFPLWQSDWQELQAINSVHHLHHRNYVCIHAGASTPARRWSYQHFAATADALAAQGFQVVLTGTAQEVKLTQALAQTMHYPVINLAGQTNLGTIAALLQQARLLICNDTGISHLAAALRVNSVVVFTNSDPQRWAPLDRRRHRIVTTPSPTPDQVLLEAMDLLQQEVVYAS